MRAIVIGAGEVGFDVAKLLALANHDVVVIDVDDEALANVAEKLDVMVTLVEAYEARHFPMDLPDPVGPVTRTMPKGMVISFFQHITMLCLRMDSCLWLQLNSFNR